MNDKGAEVSPPPAQAKAEAFPPTIKIELDRLRKLIRDTRRDFYITLAIAIISIILALLGVGLQVGWI